MNIHRALSDIAEIRAQLDRTETYRGFRSVATGVSVLFVAFGVGLEAMLIDSSAVQIDRYLMIWVGVAVASAAAGVIEMVIRSRVSGNLLVGKMHWAMARQIAPCFVVGVAVTFLIGAHAYEQSNVAVDLAETAKGASLIWALPGLWAMIYSLGIFNCRSHLPTQALGVAIFLLFVGIVLLAYGWMTREVAGWQMLVSFGVAQLYLAIVLFWNLERRGGEEA